MTKQLILSQKRYKQGLFEMHLIYVPFFILKLTYPNEGTTRQGIVSQPKKHSFTISVYHLQFTFDLQRDMIWVYNPKDTAQTEHLATQFSFLYLLVR